MSNKTSRVIAFVNSRPNGEALVEAFRGYAAAESRLAVAVEALRDADIELTAAQLGNTKAEVLRQWHIEQAFRIVAEALAKIQDTTIEDSNNA